MNIHLCKGRFYELLKQKIKILFLVNPLDLLLERLIVVDSIVLGFPGWKGGWKKQLIEKTEFSPFCRFLYLWASLCMCALASPNLNRDRILLTCFAGCCIS